MLISFHSGQTYERPNMNLERYGYRYKSVFGSILIYLCVCSTFGTFEEYFHRISDNVTATYADLIEDTSILQCATLCVQNQTCTAIQYFKDNNTCFMLIDVQEDTIVASMWSNSTISTYSRKVGLLIRRE